MLCNLTVQPVVTSLHSTYECGSLASCIGMSAFRPSVRPDDLFLARLLLRAMQCKEVCVVGRGSELAGMGKRKAMVALRSQG